MPKIVDHDQRRKELVETTWRVVARHGVSGATMRQIAEEAGFANGALKPYFATKAELLEATYSYVFAATETRIRRASRGKRGLAAVRALCREVLPVTPDLVSEARLVIAFWDGAARDTQDANMGARGLSSWCDVVAALLQQAQDDGEIRSGLDLPRLADVLLTHLYGTQVTAVLDPERFSADELMRQVDLFLELLLISPLGMTHTSAKSSG